MSKVSPRTARAVTALVALSGGATLAADQARTLDASRFGGPIKTISSYTDAGGVVRVVVAHSGATPHLDVTGGVVHLRFGGAGSRVTTQSLPSPVVGGFGATSAPVTHTSGSPSRVAVVSTTLGLLAATTPNAP